jgi:branched-chain amino acid aminotransferase
VVALVEDAATTEWPVGPVTRQLIRDFRASVTEASQVGRTLRERETGLLERRPWPARVASALQAP